MEIDLNTLIFFVIILFFLFSSPGGDGVSSQYEYNQLEMLKSHLKSEYNSFHNMTYDTNFKNVTGFKLGYEDILKNPHVNATFPIDGKDYTGWYTNQSYLLLPDQITNVVKSQVWNMSQENNIFPPNISSSLTGHIELESNSKYKSIPMPVPGFYAPASDINENIPRSGDNIDTGLPSRGEILNVTFPKGEINIKVTHLNRVYDKLDSRKTYPFNSQDNEWKLLTLQVDFHDRTEKEKHTISALAVYDMLHGRILSMSDSAKFHSLFAIPHYMDICSNDNLLDHRAFDGSKKLITEYWNTSNYIDTLTMTDLNMAYDDSYGKCEFIMFLQLDPWNQYSKDQLKTIDDELSWPLGRPANLSQLPQVSIRSGLMYSPDCGISLNLDDVKGIRYELKMRTIRHHLLFGIVLFITQIYLLLRQMQHTNTPSTVNKISYYSFSMINLVDGLLASIFFIASSVVPELYLPLIISAFASLILASIFETRYLISVYASQINEQAVGLRALISGELEVNNENRPIDIPDEATISGSLYGRFFFTLIIFTFLVLTSTSWPRGIRMVFEYGSIFILSSYWIPQIFRNAIKGIPSRSIRMRNENTVNRRQNKFPLLWNFVIGTTLIRTIPIIYVFTYSSNVFRHHKDVEFVVLLSLWLLFQVSILYSQDILGSRWFLPQHSIPEGYSYFKSVTLDYLVEHGNPTSAETYSVDCAICMSDVPVLVEDVPETHSVDKYSYMVTPCHHIFHTDCLENWMSYKLQCPVCRAPLHPI